MLRLFLPLLGVTLACGCAPPRLEAPRVLEVDRIVEKNQARSGAAGFAIGIIEGKKSSVLGYGRVSKDSDAKPAGDTVYEIGSITNGICAVLLV